MRKVQPLSLGFFFFFLGHGKKIPLVFGIRRDPMTQCVCVQARNTRPLLSASAPCYYCLL